LLAALGAAVCAMGGAVAAAQFLPGLPAQGQFEISGTVELDRVDSTVRGQLDRVGPYLAARQWDEAVETLRELISTSPERLIAVSEDESRYVALSDYVHLKLAALPPEALKLYRERVDPMALKWYEEGMASRDRSLLTAVVEEAFASSWGDDALKALGEMALERGDYARARWHFERILPAELPNGAPRTWPGYPDTDLDLAAVRARMVLARILEGSVDLARDELAAFSALHGEAVGYFGGREVNYAEALKRLLAESAAWPRLRPDPDWPTFGGNLRRNKALPAAVDGGQVLWRLALREEDAARPRPPFREGAPSDAEGAAPLSFYPVVLGDLVLVGGAREVRAVRRESGKPAWGEDPGGAIFRAELPPEAVPRSLPSTTFGQPRYTMTVQGDRLYARLGTALSSRPADRTLMVDSGYLVCLDLAAQGRLLWTVTPEEGWAFEGAPVVDGDGVYAAMRRSDVRPQAHVACFDPQTGRQRWRRFVCGAETPARGMLPEATHNLLTLCDGTLYFNTNLGAVAALGTREGRIHWVTLYCRATEGNLGRPAPHWRRDLNPCVYHRGTLLVAPADSPQIFALEAANGQILWHTDDRVADVRHLLGTTEEHLIASGEKLYWIGLGRRSAGRVEHVWPDGGEKLGYGRGVLAGESVLFPARDKIYLFDQKTARPQKLIDLAPLGVGGGNVLVAGETLLIATDRELIALGPRAGDAQDPPVAGTLRVPSAGDAALLYRSTGWSRNAPRACARGYDLPNP